MANFFDPQKDPSNSIGVTELYLAKGKSTTIALYGGGWNGTELFVRADNEAIVAWSENKQMRQSGPKRFFALTGRTEGETLFRATLTKAGNDDFTVPVKIHVVGSNLELLTREDRLWTYPSNSKILALSCCHGPAMMKVRGLCVHITGGAGGLENVKEIFQQRKVSAHFAIDKSGQVGQYVALYYQAWAQGPGNPYWISVEMIGATDARGKGGNLSEAQIEAVAKLFGWLCKRFGFKRKLAAPLISPQNWMGNVYKEYQATAEQIAQEASVSGVQKKEEANNSEGLSCHLWLQPGIKPCPGLEIIKTLPEIVRRAA